MKVPVFLFLINCFASGNVIINSDYFSEKIKNVLKFSEAGKSVCIKELKKYVDDIELQQKWALYMADASSKIPSGFFTGGMADLGSFDQCLNIEEQVTIDDETRPIVGKYCQVKLPLKDVLPKNISEVLDVSFMHQLEAPRLPHFVMSIPSLTLAMCVPNSCTEEELNTLLKLMPEFKDISVDVSNCQTKYEYKDLSTADCIYITFLVLIIFIMLLSTIYDMYIENNNKKPYHLILIAFSIYSNGKKLFSTETNSGQLQCLNGVRFLSIVWIIYFHTHLAYFYIPLINSVGAIKGLATLPMMISNNAGLAVDTFFLIGGMLMIYSFLKDKEKGKEFNIYRHYIHRYLRLTPPLVMVMLFYITIMRYFVSGPYWPTIVDSFQGNCYNYWWAVLLFIQNYVNPDEMCMDQTWYLSTDMQLYIISPLIFYFIVKCPKKTIIGLVFLTIASMVITFLVAFIFKMHGIMSIAGLTNPYYIKGYYMNTVTRCGPWLIGVILGYIIYNRKEYTKLNEIFRNKCVKRTGWVVSILITIVIVFVSITLFLPYNQIQHSLFIALHRVIWCLAVGWMIYACVINQQDFINKFLSHPCFQVLGRLSYCMYLLHFIFLYMKIGQTNYPVKWNRWNIVHDFGGNLILTMLLSIFWTLAFESPIPAIEKLLFGEGKAKSPPKWSPDQPEKEQTK